MKNVLLVWKCKVVCPEIQVLHMIDKSSEPVLQECTLCARCIEVCEDDALNFELRNYMKEKNEIKKLALSLVAIATLFTLLMRQLKV